MLPVIPFRWLKLSKTHYLAAAAAAPLLWIRGGVISYPGNLIPFRDFTHGDHILTALCCLPRRLDPLCFPSPLPGTVQRIRAVLPLHESNK